MESVIWLTILLAALFLMLAATLVMLYLHALRMMRFQMAEQSTFLSKLAEASVQLSQNAQDSAEQAVEQNRTTLKEVLTATISELDRQQNLLQKAMDLSLTRALDGSNTSQARMASTLQSAIALLGTKDPLAYQQVHGPAVPQDSAAEPYTAVDDVANMAALDEAQALLERMGGLGDAGTGPRPYSFTAA